MSGFAQHGIKHLSASSLNLYAEVPCLWVAEKLLGARKPMSYAAFRGRAVEAGAVAFLAGASMADAIEVAATAFNDETRFGNCTGDRDKEFDCIPAMVQLAAETLAPLGTPELPDHGGQHRIELECRYSNADSIPIIGFIDLLYSKEVIDLKTTFRAPSVMSDNHKLQAAIYQHATGMPVRFLYVTPSKIVWHQLAEGECADALARVKVLVRRIDALLSIGDATTIRNLVPVNAGSFWWRGGESIRKEIYGL